MLFPQGVVFIGGIAVFLHANNHAVTQGIAEFTHDADFYISLADMGDLRDIEEVTPNRRLSKHQMIKRGFEFDIYTERQSSLIVPYDQVIAHAVEFEGIRVASLEHLVVLKLEAFADRKGSVKGDKDAKDLVRVAAVAQSTGQGLRAHLVSPYLRDDHIELLDRVEKGPYVMALAQGNSMEAKRLRQAFKSVVEPVKTAYGRVDAVSVEAVAAVSKGAFSGQVVQVADGLVTQKVNRDGSSVLHRAAALSRPVKVGEVLDLKYVNGVGVINDRRGTPGGSGSSGGGVGR